MFQPANTPSVGNEEKPGPSTPGAKRPASALDPSPSGWKKRSITPMATDIPSIPEYQNLCSKIAMVDELGRTYKLLGASTAAFDFLLGYVTAVGLQGEILTHMQTQRHRLFLWHDGFVKASTVGGFILSIDGNNTLRSLVRLLLADIIGIIGKPCS